MDVVLLTSREREHSEHPDEVPRMVQEMVVALVRRGSEPELGRLAIPGTYVHADEDGHLYSAAARVLGTKCGLRDVYVEQLHTYGGAARDPRDWSVTTAYYALVPQSVLAEAGAGVWLAPVAGLSGLPFDHDRIVADALARVRSKATYSTLPALLLPDRFTWRQLEQAYECVMGRQVHTAHFRRKMSELYCSLPDKDELVPYLVDTGEKTQGDRFRPATLFRRATNEIVYFPTRF